jgi:hypothetical protein
MQFSANIVLYKRHDEQQIMNVNLKNCTLILDTPPVGMHPYGMPKRDTIRVFYRANNPYGII